MNPENKVKIFHLAEPNLYFYRGYYGVGYLDPVTGVIGGRILGAEIQFHFFQSQSIELDVAGAFQESVDMMLAEK